jgi:hypothetical protein
VLYKLKVLEVFITDCEVAEGSENKRSESCGGGFLIKTKSVMVHPVNAEISHEYGVTMKECGDNQNASSLRFAPSRKSVVCSTS